MTRPHSYSRFFQTEEIVVDGVETLGIWDPPDFLKKRPDDELIGRFAVTNAVEGRPDLIANELYRSPLLDWVLIAFNNVREPFNWPKAGEVIEYPVEMLVYPSI